MANHQYPLEILPQNEIHYLNIIEVNGGTANNLFGYMPYKRKYDKNYDTEKGDILDQKILQAIIKKFPSSRFFDRGLISIKGELEKRLDNIQGSGNTKEIKIQFTPETTNDPFTAKNPGPFNTYERGFSIRLFLEENDENPRLYPGLDPCPIPHGQLDSLVQSIKGI